MLITGVDFHPSFQAIAFLMEETGECGEQELISLAVGFSRHSGSRASFSWLVRRCVLRARISQPTLSPLG
jgi:hypothetical protein